jgi:hypothetical protein
MATFIVSFGAKNLYGGGKCPQYTWKPKLSSSRQAFLSKFIQTPQFVYFNGLLPYPLEGSLYKVLWTPTTIVHSAPKGQWPTPTAILYNAPKGQWPEGYAHQNVDMAMPFISFDVKSFAIGGEVVQDKNGNPNSLYLLFFPHLFKLLN